MERKATKQTNKQNQSVWLFEIDSLERSFPISNEGPCVLGEIAKELLGRERNQRLKAELWGRRIFYEKPGAGESMVPFSTNVCFQGKEREGDVSRNGEEEAKHTQMRGWMTLECGEKDVREIRRRRQRAGRVGSGDLSWQRPVVKNILDFWQPLHKWFPPVES